MTSLTHSADVVRKVLIEALWESVEQPLVVSIPPPVIELIVDYVRVLTWKLASFPPGLWGSMERVSDMVVVKGKGYDPAYISGDTPLYAGRHAWRVTLRDLHYAGFDASFGIIDMRSVTDCMLRPLRYPPASFYGIDTSGRSYLIAGGRPLGDSTLGALKKGDAVDFLLDVEMRTLTIYALRQGTRAVIAWLPQDIEWLPHFASLIPGNSVEMRVLLPEQAGSSCG